jgi:HD-GYP domain-containing protein (c-di-GMP phosphodiesterase class II)
MESFLTAEQHFDPKLIEISSKMDEVEGYSLPHGKKVAEVAEELGKAFNLAVHDRLIMQQASLVHDLGEIVMDREYLRENRILTAEEYLDMRRHPVIGEQEAAKQGLSRGVQLLIRWHHEWWNGDGYPDELEGEQIPLAARILRVADTFSALTGERPFRKPITAEDARRYMIEWAGIEFDPKVVKVLVSMDRLFEEGLVAGHPA